mgnify:CR=1 FL=1
MPKCARCFPKTATSTGLVSTEFEKYHISVYPNPASELIAIQIGSLVKEDVQISLLDASGKLVKQTSISKGSSIAYFDIQTVYSGIYFLQFTGENGEKLTKKVLVER